MNKKKSLQFIAKLVVSVAFVAWLVFRLDWRSVWVEAQSISVWGMLLYVAMLLFGMVISSYKWRILAKFKGFDFPLKNYFQLYLSGTFLNNFLPSFIGGDTYRAYQLGRAEKKYSAAAATVVMDRVTGLLGAMILSVFFAALNWRVVASHEVLALIVGIVIVILIGLAGMGIIMKLPIWKRLARRVPKKVLEVSKDFVEYQGSGALGQALVWSVIYSLVGLALVSYTLFWALGIQIGILNYLTVIFLISIVSSLPVSVNNIGIKEWAYVTFFGFFGVSASAVVTVALVSRILQMLVSFTALPMYLKSKK